MYEVEGLKDYGTWLHEGKKAIIPDHYTLDLAKKGYLKVIKYHITKPKGKENIKNLYKKLIEEKNIIDMKIKAYKDFLK